MRSIWASTCASLFLGPLLGGCWNALGIDIGSYFPIGGGRATGRPSGKLFCGSLAVFSNLGGGAAAGIKIRNSPQGIFPREGGDTGMPPDVVGIPVICFSAWGGGLLKCAPRPQGEQKPQNLGSEFYLAHTRHCFCHRASIFRGLKEKSNNERSSFSVELKVFFPAW